ncbi:MAG: PRC-barrel domain-containing protein [Patescibacteria group bacterium]
MLLTYSKIIGFPIFELSDQSRIGFVEDIIISPDELKIAAIAIKRSGFFSTRYKIIPFVEIVHILKDGVLIKDSRSIEEIDDLPRIKRLIEDKNFGVGQKVITENGNPIGTVSDYLIESQTLAWTKIYVKSLLKERIIPISKIVEINGKKIIVRDNLTKIKTEAPAVEIAAG